MSEYKPSSTFLERLRDAFDEMVVYKNLADGGVLSAFKLPSFMRDWVAKRFQDDEGVLDREEAAEFVRNFIPKREQWKSIQNRIVIDNEVVKILCRISIDIDIKKQEISFSLPDFGLLNKDTFISPDVWKECKEVLLRSEESWGIAELGYLYPTSPSEQGAIQLLSFRDFCPYSIDLDEFKDARSMFTLEEWVDIILAAVDYNPKGYESLADKLIVLKRLLPFVERNINLVELAPPGTGKSYLFGQVSRYGWLVSGTASRAQMIYHRAKKRAGIVSYKDFVAMDEIREAEYMKDSQMHSALQQIMENKKYKSDDGNEFSVDAGIIFLGNIAGANMNEYTFLFSELPAPFHRAPFLDRIHGFIKGWELPRMNDDMKANGWALNTEYYTTILHEMRDDASYRSIVENILSIPDKADTRDTEAIKRVSTAYLKLLFPNVRKAEDISPLEFDCFCLQPAKEMRQIIRVQMGLADPKEAGKSIPDIQTKGLYE